MGEPRELTPDEWEKAGEAITIKNRSAEEIGMRASVEAWGRSVFPGARLVHELVVAQSRRCDMAFILPDGIVGVEIKSSHDVLDRLEGQASCFVQHLSLTLIAAAPKHSKDFCRVVGAPVIRCEPGVPFAPSRWELNLDRSVTAQMLHLLWAAELRSMAAHYRIAHGPRTPMRPLIADLAQLLTGREIVAGVCRELRARSAFPKFPVSDPPVSTPASPSSR